MFLSLFDLIVMLCFLRVVFILLSMLRLVLVFLVFDICMVGLWLYKLGEVYRILMINIIRISKYFYNGNLFNMCEFLFLLL